MEEDNSRFYLTFSKPTSFILKKVRIYRVNLTDIDGYQVFSYFF